MQFTSSCDLSDVILEPLDLVTSLLHQRTQIPLPQAKHKQTVSSSPFGLLRAAGNGLTGHPAPLATPWISSELLPHSMSWMSCWPLSWQCSPSTRRLKRTGDGRLPTAVPSVSSHGPAVLLPDTTCPGAGAICPWVPALPQHEGPRTDCYRELCPAPASPTAPQHLSRHSPSTAQPGCCLLRSGQCFQRLRWVRKARSCHPASDLQAPGQLGGAQTPPRRPPDGLGGGVRSTCRAGRVLGRARCPRASGSGHTPSRGQEGGGWCGG